MFCPNGSFIDLWSDFKTSECFVDTTIATTLAVFMIFFGTAQCSIYGKYSTPLSQAAIPQSRLYYVQMIITFIFPLLAVAKFFSDIYLFQSGVAYGYQVCIYDEERRVLYHTYYLCYIIMFVLLIWLFFSLCTCSPWCLYFRYQQNLY